MGHARLNHIGSAPNAFGHHVASIIDHVGIVAGAPDHRVGADAAIKHVVRVVAGQPVGQCIPGAPNRAPRQYQILHILREGGVDARINLIGPTVCRFDDEISGRVDQEDIITVAAVHRVRPSTAVECVIAVTGQKGVVAGTAVDLVVSATGPHEVIRITSVDPVVDTRPLDHILSRRAVQVEALRQQLRIGHNPVDELEPFDTATGIRDVRIEGIDMNLTARNPRIDHQRTQGAEAESGGAEHRITNEERVDPASPGNVFDAATGIDNEHVVAIAPIENVIAVTGVQIIVAGPADQGVVAVEGNRQTAGIAEKIIIS